MSRDPIERLRRIAAAHEQDGEPDVARLVRRGHQRRTRRTAGAGAGVLGVCAVTLALLRPAYDPAGLEFADPTPSATVTATATPGDDPRPGPSESSAPSHEPTHKPTVEPTPSTSPDEPEPTPSKPVRESPDAQSTGRSDRVSVARTYERGAADRWCMLGGGANRGVVDDPQWCQVLEFEYAGESATGKPQLDATAVVCRKSLAGPGQLSYPTSDAIDLAIRKHPDHGPDVYRLSNHERGAAVETRDEFEAGACLVYRALLSEQTDAGARLAQGETYWLAVDFLGRELPPGTLTIGFGAR
jgi:hypothetical protein